jgi:uncharacterized membrane protein YhaH (DUF805 family)
MGRGDGIPRTFGNSIAICFRKYATFEGRAPRAEYWWFGLFGGLAQFGVTFLFSILDSTAGSVAGSLVNLAFFLPDIAVFVRRMHDLDRSGWWFWLFLIPIVGWIIIFVWLCTPGTRTDNRFGPANGVA